MVDLDGSRYSGSGTIVRQAVAFAALTGKSIHIRNARSRRRKPGLQNQHLRVVQAIGELVHAEMEGVHLGSQEFIFRPGAVGETYQYTWDIGSAGSTSLLAVAVVPILAFRSKPTTMELIGGLFQDFAPSVYHLQHVIVPLLKTMGLYADVTMRRPGYVPRGGGILSLTVHPVKECLHALVLDMPMKIERFWGIALASHLEERKVSQRMADAAQEVLEASGYHADMQILYGNTALQPGAALALFADEAGGTRLGADMAGAPGRRAETIGKRVAKQMIEELKAGATLDRYAADQIIPFTALAAGQTRYRVSAGSEHIESSAWLAREFLGAEVALRERMISISGVGFHR